MDLYRPILEKALFPAFEAVRGRPTVPLLRYLRGSEHASLDELRDLQGGLLRRLLRHAHAHTEYYRTLLDNRGLHPTDFHDVSDLGRLPLLDRDLVRETFEARTASAPPHWVIKKATSGTTGTPVVVKYNAESRHWRDATRWRGYGWAGYQIGMRALHYWGDPPASDSWVKRQKLALDRALKRDLYLDCIQRSDEALGHTVREIERFEPQVIVAYAAGAAALARFVNGRGLRTWADIPVIVGAERLWPHDRAEIAAAFGPAFETYGCREVMLIGAECEAHDGMHTSMENLIVEIVVREPDGGIRAARPGESGEVAITDLHNLACPMIRYITGDVAVAHAETRCACGRGLAKIGAIEGRVTETLRDGHGNAVGGLVFNVLIGVLDHVARNFQVVQKLDGSVVMKVVPNLGDRLPERESRAVHDFAAKYLRDTKFTVEYVDKIPLTRAGKRKVVVVEKPPEAAAS
jgi:phenylacetate-coenzyme A ligase PaaK-like adenylate-forming protein